MTTGTHIQPHRVPLEINPHTSHTCMHGRRLFSLPSLFLSSFFSTPQGMYKKDEIYIRRSIEMPPIRAMKALYDEMEMAMAMAMAMRMLSLQVDAVLSLLGLYARTAGTR